MTKQEAQKIIEGRLSRDPGLAARVAFDFGGDGVIFIDARTRPAQVLTQDQEADCRLLITLADFAELASGELNPVTAFMTGRLKVQGSMGIAMRLQELLAG